MIYSTIELWDTSLPSLTKTSMGFLNILCNHLDRKKYLLLYLQSFPIRNTFSQIFFTFCPLPFHPPASLFVRLLAQAKTKPITIFSDREQAACPETFFGLGFTSQSQCLPPTPPFTYSNSRSFHSTLITHDF
jgi:hypothetical protein